jgi:hypothetical protein
MEAVGARIQRVKWSVRMKDEIALTRNPEAAGDQMAREECRVLLVVGLVFDRLPEEAKLL